MELTLAANLISKVENLRSAVREFLLEHSKPLRDVNQPSNHVVIIGASYAWGALDESGRQIQTRLLIDLRQIEALMRAPLANLPANKIEMFNEGYEALVDVIEQSELSWHKTREDALERVEKSLNQWIEFLSDLDERENNAAIFVPDTNALLWNPSLEDWRFEGFSSFTLLLPATVLGELDRLKVEHRNPDVRDKADSLITRIKGYRNRGDLLAGVPLRAQLSTLRALPREPDMSRTLPWLDPTNNDDRLVAAVLEISIDHSRTPVILVTRDINLQTKVVYASMPFVEPPDPAKSPRIARGRQASAF